MPKHRWFFLKQNWEPIQCRKQGDTNINSLYQKAILHYSSEIPNYNSFG